MPQDSGLYGQLTGLENYLFYAATKIAVYGDPPLAHLGEALAAGLAALLLYAAAAVLYGRRLPRLLEEV